MKRYPFGKFVLDIPDDHRIFDIHKKDVLYDRLYGSVVEIIGASNSGGVIVDIGANIGDTAALMASVASNPIVAVEGSGEFLAFLRTNADLIGPQVSIIDKFVHVPAFESLRLAYDHHSGSGLLKTADPAEGSELGADRFIDVPGLIAHCQSMGDDIALVKSDTDGCDGFIMAELLGNLTCPLFFECDTAAIIGNLPTPWPRLFERLDIEGYSVVIFDNAGLPMCAAEKDVGALLRDLSGYIQMQRCVSMTKIFYLDVWAFPPSARELYGVVSDNMRQRYLRPYGF